MPRPSALVPIAPGFEEIETAAIVDVLRRAGVDVTLAGLGGAGPVRGSRGISFVPDAAFEAASHDVEVLVLPGGMKNAEALAADDRITALVRERVAAGRLTAAICAAPLALEAAGVLAGRQFTSYPGVEQRISAGPASSDRVVDAGVLVTSRGPGTAIAFALHLVERLVGPKIRAEVADALLV
jgi:DJ-1 family protein